MAWIRIFRNLASLQADCCLGVAHLPFTVSQVYDCLQKQLQYKITCLFSLVQRNSYCHTSHNCFPGGVQTPVVRQILSTAWQLAASGAQNGSGHALSAGFGFLDKHRATLVILNLYIVNG